MLHVISLHLFKSIRWGHEVGGPEANLNPPSPIIRLEGSTFPQKPINSEATNFLVVLSNMFFQSIHKTFCLTDKRHV
jgi:hypothetical protein